MLYISRFARHIGRDLASFYSELGETSKAVVFLMDALRSYEEQGWKDLAAQTRLELVAAAKKMNDVDRFVYDFYILTVVFFFYLFPLI